MAREKKKNPAAVALGRKGGHARVRRLTKKELSEQMKAIAKKPRPGARKEK